MGTNYYTKERKCHACGVAPTPIHLGKSSAGWKFTFQYNGGVYYKNVEEMKRWLETKVVVDEYGRRMGRSEFWRMVEAKQKEKLAHAVEHPSVNDFMIGDYSFTDCEFS